MVILGASEMYYILSKSSVIGLVVKFSVAIRATSGSPGFDSQITQQDSLITVFLFALCSYMLLSLIIHTNVANVVSGSINKVDISPVLWEVWRLFRIGI